MKKETKKGYGLDEYYEDEKKSKKKKKKKKKKYPTLWLVIKSFIATMALIAIFIYLFFYTTLFQEYKELWVVTAMSTMNHQYLATWFLSDEEIQAILKKHEVKNEENSNSASVTVAPQPVQEVKKEVTVEQISGTGYVGYVMIAPDPSKVELVDGRKSNRGSKLSEIVKAYDAIGGTNAGGFQDTDGTGMGNILCDVVILNKELLSGSKSATYSLIGLSDDHKLVLGNYTYAEAINAGIKSAVEFGPFYIVNGKNQISKDIISGVHPRMGIGQKQTGEFIFICVDGRQPGYSIGIDQYGMQSLFEKYGAYNAANLDGGSSATMYFNGAVVNSTSTPMGERYLPNAFIINK